METDFTKPRVGVSVIIFDKNGKVLVGKRKGSHGAGLYSVPGGHIELGESYDTTCDRELLEEIGVKFSEYREWGFSQDFFEHNGIKKHYITLYFVVKDVDSDTVEIKNLEPEKCEGWEWKYPHDLPVNMFCDTYSQIKAYYKNHI